MKFLQHPVQSFCGILVIYLTVSCLKAEENYYRAAVLEHVRFNDISFPSKEIVQINLRSYETAARTAAVNGADIIVFPEWGLHPHNKQNRSSLKGFAEDIPQPKEELLNPCLQKELFKNRPTLLKLSCFARDNNIFLVANMIDMKSCDNTLTCDANTVDSCTLSNTECPDDGVYFYNTNVVFNRKGSLVARYYKQHLYFEPDMNFPKLPGNMYFETDFGKFTTFICFDMTFKESVEAVESSGVINVAYPTYWFDHMPFALATPFQQSWAITNKVNLLAANVHNPGTGTLGSGIYSSSRGALIYTYNPDGYSKLLISNVPKQLDENGKEPVSLNPKRFIIQNGLATEASDKEEINFKAECNLYVLGLTQNTLKDYRCFPSNVSSYNFQKLKEAEGKMEICADKICCSLSYKADSIEEDYFFGVSGKDFKFYDSFSFGIETCLLVRCESLHGQVCANHLLRSKTVFETVEMKGNFSTKYIYPFAVNSAMRLTSRDNWSFDGKSTIVYNNANEGSHLLFLGMYGRNYDRDRIFDD